MKSARAKPTQARSFTRTSFLETSDGIITERLRDVCRVGHGVDEKPLSRQTMNLF